VGARLRIAFLGPEGTPPGPGLRQACLFGFAPNVLFLHLGAIVAPQSRYKRLWTASSEGIGKASCFAGSITLVSALSFVFPSPTS
jgi:hypothetical protein